MSCCPALPVPPVTAAGKAGRGPSGALPPGDWTELDDFPVLDCYISPFVQMPTIPTAFHPAWALVTVDILEYIENARTAGDAANVDRGLKWYLCATQLFLRRGAKAGKRGHNVLNARFTAWREGR